MTESMKLSATAINKFLFYSQNWDSTVIRTREGNMCAPGFFKIFEDSGMTEHFWSKWLHIYEDEGCHNALLNFYFNIDDQWRIALLEYIMNNYNNECKLKMN